MPEPPTGLRWSPGESLVSWTYDGTDVEKWFPTPPRSVAAWDDPPCLVVVESWPDGERLDNAVILNPDGSERVRLRPPDIWPERHWRLGFYTVYPGDHELTVVFATRVVDVHGRLNFSTGELTDVTEWR